MTEKFLLSASKYCPNIWAKFDEPLFKHSSFKIGGAADVFVTPSNEDELIGAIRAAGQCGMKYFLLGNGSNVLFSDEGFRGVVISTAALRSITRDGNVIKAQCGASLTALSLAAAQASLDGLTFAYGIPGTVGGAVFMNAGAYGGQIQDALVSSRYYNAETDTYGEFNGVEHDFSYRKSVYNTSGGRLAVLDASFLLGDGNEEKLTQTMNDFMSRRREKQPLEYPSAGSVFKRPEGCFAGQLIEECGLKGYSFGGAQISEKHAGFIINRGGATAKDVLSLVEYIKETVLKKYGVELECEICVIPSGK